MAAARAVLGEEFAEAFDAGRRLSREQILADVEAVLDAAAQSAPRAAGDDITAALGLTPRELQVLRLVAAGHSNREIADALFISVPTVKSHLTNVLGKLGLPSRSAATAYAHTHGLL
jgi:DNA-binding CsgD family transcriptional regulator